MDNLGDLAGLTIGFIFTLLIFSFILRDNPLYRLAVHLLVGVSAAYTAVVAVQEVLWPVLDQMLQDPAAPESLTWVLPVILGSLLLLFNFLHILTRFFSPLASVVNSSLLAVLIGVGAAVGLIGAIAGTLIPQVVAPYGGGLVGLLVSVLTAFTLLYFHFTGRLNPEGEVVMPRPLLYVSHVGRTIITVALGALFAGILNTSLILLADRVNFFVQGLVDNLLR